MEMTIREYAKAAGRTINPKLSMLDVRNHALFEMASELGEVHAIYQKQLQGHEVVKDHLIEELGDLMWGVMELCFAEKIDPQEVFEYNIDKLLKRYPDGFDPERSIHREV
ncbi:MAG: nucleotide pyrophosphohydrolase [Clostridia bacterium]|nr:nucleotide pyrophosphohydrolase [Clostridia bacterium]MBQ9212222.1 nucleotide pyrophosphohydrolase [Clostridia bacterium]